MEISNKDLQLKPGMFVRLAIEFVEHRDATVIPRTGLVRYRDQQGVFQPDAEGKTVQFVPVRTGIVNGTVVEVLDPPLSGSIVTLGHHLLSDGAAVVISTFGADAAGKGE